MDRRTFLGCCGVAGLTVALGQPSLAAPASLVIADPHAHPFQLQGSRTYDRTTPTVDSMKQAGVALSAFSAVGDMTYYRGHTGNPFSHTENQLRKVANLEQSGQIALVLKPADLSSIGAPGAPLAGLMAIEGGDALDGLLANLAAFYEYGVRMLTLMHDRDNEIGFSQRSPSDGPLTPFGIKLVEKMNALGMVVDVAHAKAGTLKSIAEVSAAPLIDSHTSPSLAGDDGSASRRLRSWAELELIAKSGGLVCSWPFGYTAGGAQRTTLKQWADEIAMMKTRLGIEHCGLGTDGGGGLPRAVDGWQSIASLPALIAAMQEAGLTQADIAAFVGGNFLRLLKRTLA
jgi:microsomal dipeptidase-like Zn-dependent dipeptidase